LEPEVYSSPTEVPLLGSDRRTRLHSAAGEYPTAVRKEAQGHTVHVVVVVWLVQRLASARIPEGHPADRSGTGEHEPAAGKGS